MQLVEEDRNCEDQVVLAAYARDYSLEKGVSPLLAVFPKNKEDVKGIVRLANEYKVPLVAVSSGQPRFNGDTLPERESVIIDFRQMNRTIKIDSVNRCAIVEPGVTYAELIPQLEKQGLKLNIPFLPKASKSVVTSRLEREPVLIPKYQYDYIDPLLTLELVWGNGDEFRTGSASGPGDLEQLKSDKVNPWGPGSIDYFRFLSGAQGTLGLVTWASVKVEVLPSIQHFYYVPVEEVGQAMAVMNELLRKRVVDECLALNNVNLATILEDRQSDDYRQLKINLPPWTVITSVAGYQRRPEERLALQTNMLTGICEAMGLKLENRIPGAEGREMKLPLMLTQVWQEEPYWKLRRTGSALSLFYLSPLSRTSEYISLAQAALSGQGYTQEAGWYLQPMVQGRGCHCELNLPFNEDSEFENLRMKGIFKETSQALFKKGAFFSRPYGDWANMVYRQDEEGTAAQKKLKVLFDPNHILNPGKLCFRKDGNG